MCGPITPMMALSIAGSAFQFIQGQQQAKAAAKAERANLNYQYKMNQVKQQQINEKYALEAHERMKQGIIDRGEARTISGESGALGFTANRLLADSMMQEGTDLMSIEKNRANAIKQTEWDNNSAKASAQSKTNAAYNNAPGLIDTGLQIAGDIYSANDKVATQTKKGTSPWT
jgi:hypothetical protein